MLKLVYQDLLERAKAKEQKEAKRRQRLADDFSRLLQLFKVFLELLMMCKLISDRLSSLTVSWPSMVVLPQEISASSNWEDSKQLFEESEDYR